MGKRGPKPKRKEIVWSLEFAYGVGLMVSDGNLSTDGRHLSFVSKDLEQTENIKECFGVTANIRPHTHGTVKGNIYHRLQWGDVVLYDFLLSIGLMPNKSLIMGAISIPDEYFFDFLRGSHDGDGSFLSYYDPRWKSSFMFYLSFISASKEHIEWLQQRLASLIGVRGAINSSRNSHMFQLRYAKAETLRVLERMYENSKAIHLKRKKLKIMSALRIVGKSLPELPAELDK